MTRPAELNLDGLVGPTHNYAGLSFGNVASMANRAASSNPRAAALEGLGKMKFLADLGLTQAVLPPHERPHVPTLRRLGFTGTDADILDKCFQTDPTLLTAVSSASAMWAANAATVSPSADTADAKVHFTPANLLTNLHRAIETPTTTRILRAIFGDANHFTVHDALPSALRFSDEGAANHTRLTTADGKHSAELFTFGQSAGDNPSLAPTRFPARQTLEASQTVARLHQLPPDRVAYVRQSARAIDAGAFHNDVVAVGHRNILFFHEFAWDNTAATLTALRRVIPDLFALQVPQAKVPLSDAIATYLFNSQLLTLPNGQTALLAPLECRENAAVRNYLAAVPFDAIHYVDVRQSMRNGGGPACLRLRVPLTPPELAAMHAGVLLTPELYAQLHRWILTHYREELTPADPRDPALLTESRTALDELTRLLGLGNVYDFQS